MFSTSGLEKAGLLNIDAPDYGELASTPNRDARGTWCFSFTCAGNNDRGRLVHVGAEYKPKCPNCGSRHLFYDSVAAHRSRDLKQQVEAWLDVQEETRNK